MLETIIVVLLILWLFGLLGPVTLPDMGLGNHGAAHILLVVVVILVLLRLVGRL